jgi:hypothetical protein
MAAISVWHDFQTVGTGLEFVTNAAHLRHHRRHVFALAFEHADLLGQAVALGLQLFGAALDGLAFGFERAVGGLVQEGLRVLALGQAGQHAVEVFAQQGNVKHGEESGWNVI